jgi:tetratricopeptide (TPR) repeat protein
MILLALFMLSFGTPASGETLPEWFLPLREAVYEQELTAAEIEPIYRDISAKARASLSGEAQYIMLSRSEYMMGRAYRYEERKDEAAARFGEGMAFAQKALDIRKSAEAWQMLAENLSQSCAVRSTSFAIANGLNVEKYAKNALAIDGRNAAAGIIVASRWVYAPAPFYNHNRGIEMMSAVLNGSDNDKDDLFNIYSAIGYAYMQQKKNAEAKTWLLKSLEVYPTHKYVQSLIEKL